MMKTFFQSIQWTLSMGAVVAGLTVNSTSGATDSGQPHLQIAATKSTNSSIRPGQVPGRNRGGASRGDCPAVQTPLTALVPATLIPSRQLPDLPETYVGGVTIAEYPSFWFYVPYRLNQALQAEFILKNATEEVVYQVTSQEFPPSEISPGIIRITLPPTTEPLTINQSYRWFFKVHCDESPVEVSGGIQRIAPPDVLSHQLATAFPPEQAQIYWTKHEIWYDAITSLGNFRRENPTDRVANASWDRLLQEINLTDIPNRAE